MPRQVSGQRANSKVTLVKLLKSIVNLLVDISHLTRWELKILAPLEATDVRDQYIKHRVSILQKVQCGPVMHNQRKRPKPTLCEVRARYSDYTINPAWQSAVCILHELTSLHSKTFSTKFLRKISIEIHGNLNDGKEISTTK